MTLMSKITSNGVPLIFANRTVKENGKPDSARKKLKWSAVIHTTYSALQAISSSVVTVLNHVKTSRRDITP